MTEIDESHTRDDPARGRDDVVVGHRRGHAPVARAPGRVAWGAIDRSGAVWGACAPARPELDFHNTVHRLLPDDLEQVPRIAELYAAAGVRPWLELMPAPGFERLAAALREAGARQVDFLGVFERELPKTPSSYAPAIDILQPPPDIEEFSTVLLTGHG